MKSEDEIRARLKMLKHDVDYTDCSRIEYCRMYAKISILEWVLKEGQTDDNR